MVAMNALEDEEQEVSTELSIPDIFTCPALSVASFFDLHKFEACLLDSGRFLAY